MPSLRPTFEELLSDGGGKVWVRENRRWEHEQPRWWAFDTATGEPIGYIEVPPEPRVAAPGEIAPGFSVVQIGPDFVLGFYWDELMVNYVRRFSFRPPSRD